MPELLRKNVLSSPKAEFFPFSLVPHFLIRQNFASSQLSAYHTPVAECLSASTERRAARQKYSNKLDFRSDHLKVISQKSFQGSTPPHTTTSLPTRSLLHARQILMMVPSYCAVISGNSTASLHEGREQNEQDKHL